jgi:hypothetical protein
MLHAFATRRISHQSLPQLAKNLVAYGIGAFLPILLFEAAKVISLGGWHNYLGNALEMKGAISDINKSALHPDAIFMKISKLGEFLGIIHVSAKEATLFALLTLLTLIVLATLLYKGVRYLLRRLPTPLSPIEWASDVLLWGCVAHLMWWIFLCSSVRSRYAVEALLYGSASLALAISQMTIRDRLSGAKNLLIAAASILCLRCDALAYLESAFHYDPAFDDQRQALQALQTVKQNAPDTLIFSCGYIFEMEYLLPGVANVTECDRINDPVFSKKPKVLLSFTYNNKYDLLSFGGGFASVVWRHNPSDVLALCPASDIYSGDHYFIASCRKP